MGVVKDMTGLRFGRLTVIRREGTSLSPCVATWRCLCDCGCEVVVRGDHLRSNRTKSCGCFRRAAPRELHTTHGKSRTRLHVIWNGMNSRCYSPACKNYHRYGGRGITVCDEWRNDFRAFYEWAMASGYDENAPRGQCTIDRIDNDKGYSPDNCRWVDMNVQNNNKSNSKKEKNK